MPDTLHSVHRFFSESVRAFPFWKDELRPQLEETLSGYLGRQGRIDLSPQVHTLEEWLIQQLALSFSSESDGSVIPLNRMGDGWQSLVRLATLDVLRHYPEELSDRVTLLNEEPETFLHPHLRRKLRQVLADLATAGWTVICATHAPEFVSFQHRQQILRLHRGRDIITGGILLTENLPDGPKFQELIDENGNHEMFFANRLVLCEGKDDVIALRSYLEKAQTDLDGRSVTILDVGGRDNLPHYARMATKLAIPWCAITDEDSDPKTGQVNEKTASVRTELQGLASVDNLSPMWPGSLEIALGIEDHKASPAWQQIHLLPRSIEDIRADHPSFSAVCEEIMAWI